MSSTNANSIENIELSNITKSAKSKGSESINGSSNFPRQISAPNHPTDFQPPKTPRMRTISLQFCVNETERMYLNSGTQFSGPFLRRGSHNIENVLNELEESPTEVSQKRFKRVVSECPESYNPKINGHGRRRGSLPVIKRRFTFDGFPLKSVRVSATQPAPSVSFTADPVVENVEGRILQSQVSASEKSDKQKNVKQTFEPENRSRWISLGIIYLINFLMLTQKALYRSSLWPFLAQIDPKASENFFGFVIMAYNIGLTIGSTVLGVLSNRLKQTKLPIIIGIVLMIVGNCILAFVEILPTNRRYLMLIARILTGFGAGNSATIFAYIAMASKVQERSRAIALQASINAFAQLLGPAIQIAFVAISYPGYNVGGWLNFNMYTAAAFTNIFIGIISIAIMVIFFKEYWVSVETSPHDDVTKVYKTPDSETKSGGIGKTVDKPKSIHKLLHRSRLEKIEETNEIENDSPTNSSEASKASSKIAANPFKHFDSLAIAASLYVRIVILFCASYDSTIGSPFTMIMFRWSREEAVKYNGIISIVSGVINVPFNLFLGFVVMKRVSERNLLIGGLASFFVFFLLTFSWPGMPGLLIQNSGYISANAELNGNETVSHSSELNPMEFSNENATNSFNESLSFNDHELYGVPLNESQYSANSTTPKGFCRYKWCPYTTRVHIVPYLISCICVLIAFALAYTPNNSLYSKLLGTSKQGTMLGLSTSLGQISITISPVFVSYIFEFQGPRIGWGVAFGVLVSAMIVVLATFSRLVPWVVPEEGGREKDLP